MHKYEDSFFSTFSSFLMILDYHNEQEKNSQWMRCNVSDLSIEPIDVKSPYYSDLTEFAKGITKEAVEDTAVNLGLAIRLQGILYPLRNTAYKSLLDRAKINGTALPKLPRKDLADILNHCLKLHSSKALLLFRDQKIAAVHSGDASDYSVLPINELLSELQTGLDSRFLGNKFADGFCNHSIVSASWTMPNQKEHLLGTYEKMLSAQGKTAMAKRLIPGVQFFTSDVGVSSAKVSALLMGGQYPISIGSCISVDHRHNSKVYDFNTATGQIFSQYTDLVAKLQNLLSINLHYSVNAMMRICKKLCLPKKAALEAIAMYEIASGGGPATAHDVFFAMQEIPFILKTQNTSESKLLEVQESLSRALSLKWSDYDIAKAVNY